MAKDTYGRTGDELISQHNIREHLVAVYGCFEKDTVVGTYDSYQVFIEVSGGMFCMNEDHCLEELPDPVELDNLTRTFLESLD